MTPARQIGQKMESLKALKQNLKKGGGGTFIKYIPKEGAMTVRFLEEPTEWVNYYEHFDGTIRKSYPCIETQCPGCATEERRTSRYLANALDVEADRVIPLQLPKTLVSSLVAMYERMQTLTDRDIELVRSGEGLDTEYTAIPESPTKRNLGKYEPHDLSAVLDESFNSVFGGDTEPEAASDNGSVTPKRRGRPPGSGKKAAVAVDDESGVDEEATPVRPAKNAAAAKAAKKPPAAPKKKASEPTFTPEVDEDDDEPEPFPVDESDVDVSEEIPDMAAEDDFYTEEDLKSMPLGELRAVARDYGINTKGVSRGDLIEAILNPEDE